ncbi:MAG TPA: hypothetical protein K8V90_07665 [Romboutsia timonensis]|uniref:Uncharacterized protein n=1 Tax=Romboutsia timonensis TaxID=1776391 RepID=A0A921N2J8_9FIRM|nr:hypothetical protein [uncultured Romboutsia sp.]HJG96959.1 hypothetical protein [Romboutsia timonensis]
MKFKILINGYTVSENIEIKMNNDFIKMLDKSIEHIKKNKKKYMTLVILIALTVNLSCINAFAVAPGAAAIDAAGQKILDLVRKVGYWIGVILCSKDVLKHCMRGHLDSIGSVIAMYGMSFGALYFLPWLFDLIKNIFG